MTALADRVGGDSGQSTVELALILPIVVTLILVCVQVGLVMRDRLLLVNSTRAVARAVIVSPDIESAREVLREQGPPTSSAGVSISGPAVPGSLVQVGLTMKPTAIPIVGRVVSALTLEESLSVRVEGGR